MKMNEREDLAKAGAMLIAAGVVGLNYLRIKRSEEKKRELIRQHELESRAVIKNFRRTMEEVILDPDVSVDEIWRRMHEENDFVKIVINNRPY